MPSGYTHALYDLDNDPPSFRDFAMECSRAFGALILLRDDPRAEIPEEFEPATYHRDKLAEAQAKVAELARRTHDEWAEVAS